VRVRAFLFSAMCENHFVPHESHADKFARTQKILSALKRVYPDAHCELNHSSPLQLLVATILSAQCTDKRVNLVTAELFKTYRSAKDFAAAPLADIEEAVKSTGFFRNKAKNIKACCATLVGKFGGEVPRTMDELHALAGVGRKTANVVLGNAFGINVGVVVDTHVTRLSNRLGLVKGTDAVKLEQQLMPLIPQNDWTLFSHQLIWHGRRRCDARKPDCLNCEIRNLCPQIGVEINNKVTKEQR
jgi:endonuclease III